MEGKKRKKRAFYNHGLPFSISLADNLDRQKLRVEDERKASLILFDGSIGEGKTTLMVHCADYINGAYEKQPEGNYIFKEKKAISFTDQLAMGGVDFSKKLRLCHNKKLGVVIYDEAGDFSKRGSLTKLNALINRIFETYRGFRIIVLMGLPSARVLDSSLIDKGIIRMLVHCHNRLITYGNFRAYSLYRTNYIINKMLKLVIKNKAYQYTRPNIRGNFLDLPPERSKKLDDFSTKGKFKMMSEGEINYEGLMTYKELSAKLNMGVGWIMGKMKAHNIKPKKTFKRVRYFEASVLDRLADMVER